ncbi:MAG: hypothetical protein ACHQQR_04580 [Gemmatimonadales bacterium]
MTPVDPDPRRRPWDLYVLGALLVLVASAQHAWNEGVTSDGSLYFAHLRSLIFDRDLQIGPELAFLRLPPRPHHVVPIGPSILWAPLYLIVAFGDWLSATLGLRTRATGVALGLTLPYMRATFASSLAVAAAGLFAIHLRLRQEFGAAIALVTSTLTLLATPLAWYIVFEPSMTHAASFGVVSLALVASERWLSRGSPTRGQAITIGALFALAILVRPEDGLFLVFPAVLIFGPYARWRTIANMAIGAAPLILIQAAMLYFLLASSNFSLAGGDEGYLSLASSHVSDVLFSSRHGLLSWTPLVWAGLAGILIYRRRNPRWAWPTLFVFVALVWINGSAHDWAGGWAFGGRRFVSILGALAPGVALAAWSARRHMATILAPLAVVLIAWNVTLMAQYHDGRIPRDETISWADVLGPRLGVLVRPPSFYPFGFPANVWFAWREGLPAARYDLLGSEPLRQEMYLPLNDWGARFLLDPAGWENAAADASGSRHILRAASGTILVPLDIPSTTAIALDVEARADGPSHDSPTSLDVALNGRPVGAVPLLIGVSRPARQAFVLPAGSRVWRRGYNRVTISQPPTVPPSTQFLVYALRVGPATGPGQVR